MLDQVADPVETEPAAGARFMAMAQDIRQRIAAEDREYDATIAALVAPIRDRLHRFPHRSLRQETLATLIQSWRYMDPRNWRLGLDASLHKARASLIEHRLVAGMSRKAGDPNWRGVEQDIALIRVQLDVNRAHAHLASTCIATLSLNAIGRRLQRHQDGSIEALLYDVNLIATAPSDALVSGAGYRVRTDADGGGWRGRVIYQTGPDGVSRRVLAVRTWLPE